MCVCDLDNCSSSSTSNLILMSCQSHRVTSGQSNSGHKQIHISKLFSHIYQPSVKSIYKTNHFANIKNLHTQTSDQSNITHSEKTPECDTCDSRVPVPGLHPGGGGVATATDDHAQHGRQERVQLLGQ